MKRSHLCFAVGAGFLGILIPSFFDLLADPPRGWGRSNSSVGRQCTTQRRGPNGETITVPVECSGGSRRSGEAGSSQSGSNARVKVINITNRGGSKTTKPQPVLPKGFYSVDVDGERGEIWIKYHENVSGMENCDIAAFTGDPKLAFGRKIGQKILDARPANASGSIRLGVLNRGGQAAIARCLDRGKIGLAPLGLCAGDAVGGIKFAPNGEISFSESCGGGSDRGSGGCKDTAMSPGGGSGASDAFENQFMGPNAGGGEAMSGGSGSRTVGQALQPGETRYTTYDYFKGGGSRIISTTIGRNNDYTVRDTTCVSEGCFASTYTGNLLDDDLFVSREIVQSMTEIEQQAQEEQADREASADDTQEDEKIYARVERRGEMPSCDASGENCSGGGGWRAGFPVPTNDELRRAIGNAAHPQRPGNQGDCFGDDCGGSGQGAPQSGVTLSNAMMTSLPGSGLVDPMGPDSAGRTGGGGPSAGGDMCSPSAVFWVPNGKYALDCDMRAQGGCDNQASFRQAFQAIRQSKGQGNRGAAQIQRGVQRSNR